MERPHIVRIWQTIILVETILQRQELFLASQMPFTEDSGTISFLFQYFSDRHLVRMNPIVRIRPRSAGETDTIRITTGQQAGPRRSTDRLSRQEMCKTNAFRRHSIDIRSGIPVSPVTRKISITHIIQINQDDIRVIRSHACH